MAAQQEGGGKDEIKTQFITREGTYTLMPLSEYSKPARAPYNGQTTTPVKVSFVKISDGSGPPDRICFNVGRELYFYVYKGVRKAADLTKPIDKRIYKGTFPTCHDFNTLLVNSESVRLLVGFTAGQIQLIDPIMKDNSKLYNEERLIDKTKVTCVKWIPGSPNQFIVSHTSGQIYVYNEELPCGPTPPHYQPFKQGDTYSIHTCKTKSTRNPLYRWVIGQGAINEFAFSPCSSYLAVVSQDGYLRVFNYDSMDLVGTMKSYFGGILCVCWSSDGKFIVTGGEDDLVSVWSFQEKRVVCRGYGHKSWVNVVAFDLYTSTVCDCQPSTQTENIIPNKSNCVSNKDSGIGNSTHNSAHSNNSLSRTVSNYKDGHQSIGRNSAITTYRFGSVGQDTMLCLWDLTEDVIKLPMGRIRTSVLLSNSMTLPRCNSLPHSQKTNATPNDFMDGYAHPMPVATVNLATKFATLSLAERKDNQEKREHKRNFSLAGRSDKASILKSNHVKSLDNSVKLLGTHSCPRLEDVTILEPLVCKKVATERLTSLVFREECIVTACQEGLVYTWARPGANTAAFSDFATSGGHDSGVNNT